MNPILALAYFAVEQLIKHAPEMFVQFREVLSKPDITVEEIRARRHALAEQKFEDLVPNSQDRLPPGVPEM